MRRMFSDLHLMQLSQELTGVDMGRNIWQSDYPVAMIQAVRSVVHEGFDVESAYRKFLSLKQSKVSKRELAKPISTSAL